MKPTLPILWQKFTTLMLPEQLAIEILFAGMYSESHPFLHSVWNEFHSFHLNDCFACWIPKTIAHNLIILWHGMSALCCGFIFFKNFFFWKCCFLNLDKFKSRLYAILAVSLCQGFYISRAVYELLMIYSIRWLLIILRFKLVIFTKCK